MLLIYVLLVPMLFAIYAYAVGNMDVKSVGTSNYLLFHLRLRSPTFRPPLRLKFFCVPVNAGWPVFMRFLMGSFPSYFAIWLVCVSLSPFCFSHVVPLFTCCLVQWLKSNTICGFVGLSRLCLPHHFFPKKIPFHRDLKLC